MDGYNFWAAVKCPQRKNYWLELAGKSGEYAASVIRRESPTVDVIVISEATASKMGSQENKCGRVFVVVNEYGIVTSAPFEG